MVSPYSPNWMQQQQLLQAQAGQLKGRPVTSIEEVKGSSIEFDGSVFYFPDLANKRIYTKQINVDGTSTINMYEYKPLPQNANPNYVTHEEFEQALEKLSAALQASAATVPQSAPVQTKAEVPAYKF